MLMLWSEWNWLLPKIESCSSAMWKTTSRWRYRTHLRYKVWGKKAFNTGPAILSDQVMKFHRKLRSFTFMNSNTELLRRPLSFSSKEGSYQLPPYVLPYDSSNLINWWSNLKICDPIRVPRIPFGRLVTLLQWLVIPIGDCQHSYIL